MKENIILSQIFVYKQSSTAKSQIIVSFKTIINNEFERIEILLEQNFINKISNENLKFLVGNQELSLERIVFGVNFDHKEEIFRDPTALLTLVCCY